MYRLSLANFTFLPRRVSVIPVLRSCFLSRMCTLPPFLMRPYSVQRGGRVEIIANDQGHRITPSWVAFTDEERLCVLPSAFSLILALTLKLGSVTRPKMRSTLTLPTRSSTPNVSSVVRSMSQICNATLSIGERFPPFLSSSSDRFGVVGLSKSSIKMANQVYRSNIAARSAIL